MTTAATTICSTITPLKSPCTSLQTPAISSSSSSSSCKFGTNLVSNEALTIAAATEAVVLARAAVSAAREAVAFASLTEEVWFDGESGTGVERDGRGDLQSRRRKRRKRRKGVGSFDVDEWRRDGQCQQPVMYEPVQAESRYLSQPEEAEFCLCLQDQARLEEVRRRIAETQQDEPTLDQLAKALKMKKMSVDRIFCKGRESLESITRSHRRLVVSIATGYRGKGLSLQDLIQEGSIGLLRGARKFDPKRGYKLSTYAYWWIREAIISAISNKGKIIRLPGSTLAMGAKIAEVNSALGTALRRSPSYDEIAEVLNVHVSKVRLGFGITRSPLSLDRSLTDQGCMTLQEIIAGPDERIPEKIIEKQLMKSELEKILQTLSEREVHVLKLKFGLNGQTPQSCEEIGRLLKLSGERIRQIKVIALSKLRHTRIANNFKEYYV